MNLQEIRQKYPQYNDLTDQELVDSFHKKYYSDVPKSEFYKKVEFNTNEPTKTSLVTNKTKPSVTADAAASFSSGILKGLSFIPGIPGDIERLSTYLPGGKKTGGFDYGQPGNDESFGKSTTGKYLFPSTKQIQNYFTNPVLQKAFNYQPKTTPGRYLQTASEFAIPGVANKSAVAREAATKLGAGGGLLFQGTEDLTGSSGIAAGVTIPSMLLGSKFMRPNTASQLAKDALENVSDAEITAARNLEKTGQEIGINLTPGEVFDNKNIRNLTRDVVSSEKGSPIIYASAKDRRDNVIKIAEKQADAIANAPQSQRVIYDTIGDTATESIKKAKLDRSITAQNAGYNVSNTESLLPEQVFNVIDKIDEAIKTLPKSNPSVAKLNQIKNQLIKNKKKVKGKKKLEIIPETNINKLDSTFKQFRDDYKKSNQNIASESRFIDKQLGYKLFNETDDAILNTLNKELRTNTNYANANDTFAKLSDDLVKVVENNVLPLAKGKVNETTIKSFIFDPKKNNVADINKTFEILNKTNPEASIQIANVYFRNALNQSFKMTKQGDDLTQGFKLIESIAGTGQQRKNFMAVIDNVAKSKNVNSQELKVGFEKMINVLERTGRVANLNNPGFDFSGRASKALVKDLAMMKTFNPMVRLATKYGEFKAGRAWEELANVFVQDNSVDALIDLAKINPQSKKAALRVLQIVDASQGIQSEPLTENDERQLYLEDLNQQ